MCGYISATAHVLCVALGLQRGDRGVCGALWDHTVTCMVLRVRAVTACSPAVENELGNLRFLLLHRAGEAGHGPARASPSTVALLQR